MSRPRIQLGDMSTGFVYPVISALESLGICASPLLQRFGLSAQQLAAGGARLSIPHYMRLGHAAIELSANPALGLLMGAHSRLEHFALAGACAALAPDVRSALRTLTMLEPLYARNYLGQSSLQESAAGAWVSFYSIAPYNDYNRFVVDAVLTSWHSHMQQVVGGPVSLERVQIEYPAPPHAAAFEQAFGCPVEFSAPANRILCSPDNLALNNPRHCPPSWHELQALGREQLARQQRPTSLSEQVCRMLAAQLRKGEPDLTGIARQLQLPAWTFQRRLEQEGSNFRQLLQETRHSLAISYLRDTRLSLAEIAWQLGFSSSEAFQRAFKRWQGETPGRFRLQAAASDPA